MTVIREVPETEYTARTSSEDIVLPEKAKELRLSLSRVDWPQGECATVDILYPDGTVACTFGMSGGPSRRPDTVIFLRNANGLPPGTYRLRFNVKQTMRTAIKVEGNERLSEIPIIRMR